MNNSSYCRTLLRTLFSSHMASFLEGPIENFSQVSLPGILVIFFSLNFLSHFFLISWGPWPTTLFISAPREHGADSVSSCWQLLRRLPAHVLWLVDIKSGTQVAFPPYFPFTLIPTFFNWIFDLTYVLWLPQILSGIKQDKNKHMDA